MSQEKCACSNFSFFASTLLPETHQKLANLDFMGILRRYWLYKRHRKREIFFLNFLPKLAISRKYFALL